MNAQELREKSEQELAGFIDRNAPRTIQYAYAKRFRATTSVQSRSKAVRREIARIKTILGEKKAGNQS